MIDLMDTINEEIKTIKAVAQKQQQENSEMKEALEQARILIQRVRNGFPPSGEELDAWLEKFEEKK